MKKVKVSALALFQARVIALLKDVGDELVNHLVYYLFAPDGAPLDKWRKEIAAMLHRVGAAKVKATKRPLDAATFWDTIEDHLEDRHLRRALRKLRDKGLNPLTTDLGYIRARLEEILRDFAVACEQGRLTRDYVSRRLRQERPHHSPATRRALLLDLADRIKDALVDWDLDQLRNLLDELRLLSPSGEEVRLVLRAATYGDEKFVKDAVAAWPDVDAVFRLLTE